VVQTGSGLCEMVDFIASGVGPLGSATIVNFVMFSTGSNMKYV
jgi:hypothetical protein